LRLCIGLLALEQILQFFQHGLDVVKRTVDAGKTNVGDLIHTAQMFHHQLTNSAAWQFLLSLAVEFLLNILDRVLNISHRERTFLAGFADASKQLLTIKRLAPQIAFGNHQLRFFNALIRAETPLTLLALASAMNRVSHIARIFHTRLRKATKWTFHSSPIPLLSAFCSAHKYSTSTPHLHQPALERTRLIILRGERERVRVKPMLAIGFTH